jgi:hypothetical protein
MKTEEFKAIYLDLSDTYVKFTLARLVIMTTIFITLYESINSKKYEELVSYYNRIENLSQYSYGVPVYNNWFIDGMFGTHGIYSSDSLRALQSVYYTQDSKFAYTKILDTATISTARIKQLTMLDSINRKLPEIFLLKIDFISSQPLNIQYWIFLLPFLYILSCIYGYTLKRKLDIVVYRSKVSRQENTITDFERYPTFYLIQFIKFCNFLVLIGSALTFFKIINDFGGYQGIIVYGSILLTFFSIIFANQVIVDMDKRFVELLPAVKLWKFVRQKCRDALDKVSSTFCACVGMAILVTLVVISIFSDLDLISNSSDNPFFFFRNDRWYIIKNIQLTRSRLDIIFLAHNSMSVNNFEIDFSIIYQSVTFLTIAVSILLLFEFLTIRTRKLNFSRSLSKLLFSFSVLIYIFTITFYGLQMRSFHCALFAIITISWVFYKNDKFFRYNQFKANKVARNTFLLTLPFLVLNVIYSAQRIAGFTSYAIKLYPSWDKVFYGIYWNTIFVGILFPIYTIFLLLYSYKLLELKK